MIFFSICFFFFRSAAKLSFSCFTSEDALTSIYLQNNMINLFQTAVQFSYPLETSENQRFCGVLTLSWQRPYHIETSLLTCSANQWISFYMIGTTVTKELKEYRTWILISNGLTLYVQNGQTYSIRRLLPKNCLSLFDHFMGLKLKGLTESQERNQNSNITLEMQPPNARLTFLC